MANSSGNPIHGLRRHPLYDVWAHAKQRCYDPDTKQFRDWGGRGITMCDRWRNDPRAFIEDVLASIGPRPVGMVFDRIRNDGNYEPGNIKWSTYAESNRNRRDALAPENVVDIKNRLAAGESGASIARSYDVTRQLVWQIKTGRVWADV